MLNVFENTEEKKGSCSLHASGSFSFHIWSEILDSHCLITVCSVVLRFSRAGFGLGMYVIPSALKFLLKDKMFVNCIQIERKIYSGKKYIKTKWPTCQFLTKVFI